MSTAAPFATPRMSLTATGSMKWTAEQYAIVLDVMQARHAGPDAAIHHADLVREVGIPGRTTRAILAHADGRDVLLGQTPDGVFVCTEAIDADSLDRSLSATASTVSTRLERRRALRQQMEIAS